MAREQVLVFDPSFLVHGGLASIIATLLIFKWLGPSISSKMVSGYSDLPKHRQSDWNDRMASNLNATISITMSVGSLLYEQGMREDIIWYDSYYARLACGFVAGYMVADALIMTVWCKVERGEYIGYLFHHAATLYAYFFISSYGVLCYFGMLRLMAEMSTPFVNLRWFFDKIGIPRSRPCVIINGFMMLLSFTIFRICTMPIYWYQVWLVTGIEPVLKLGHIMLIMYIPCFVLDVLNIYWFYKMCRGFIKVLREIYNQSDKLKMV